LRKKRPGKARPKSNREVETTGGMAAGFAMDIGKPGTRFKKNTTLSAHTRYRINA
tara:strand:- start:677 stop:841 length:165 start_codon:yes stop_codon:yes gene_type:complete